MATYKELHGTDIEVRSTDPSDPVTGQLWYNTTTDQIKGAKQFVGNAWSTANDFNSRRFQSAGTGTQTDAILFNGIDGSTGNETTVTETWNGTNWTEDGDLSTGRDGGGGSGISNSSGLYFGGRNEPTVYASTEEFTGAGAAVTRTFTDS